MDDAGPVRRLRAAGCLLAWEPSRPVPDAETKGYSSALFDGRSLIRGAALPGHDNAVLVVVDGSPEGVAAGEAKWTRELTRSTAAFVPASAPGGHPSESAVSAKGLPETLFAAVRTALCGMAAVFLAVKIADFLLAGCVGGHPIIQLDVARMDALIGPPDLIDKIVNITVDVFRGRGACHTGKTKAH